VTLDPDRYAHDPVAFISEVLVDPETKAPFELYPAQVAFLRAALTLGDDGRLPAPELLYGAPKKSGKTAMAAMCTLYVVLVLAGPYGEAYVVANDLEQAQGRVFTAIERIIKASPMLAGAARITGKKIEFPHTGATIEAIASDYAGAAGSNAHFVCFDELWAFTTERSRRLWDEMVPPPTRRVAARFTTTYAGFEGESVLLEDLYKRGRKGKKIAPDLYKAKGLVMAWHHKPVAPWQTEEWLQQMREQLRPNAYIRMIENKFVTTESSFVDMDWWDACIDWKSRLVLEDRELQLFVGIDASTKGDQTAIVGCTYDKDSKRVRLVFHRIFRPSKENPLDFEATIEQTIKELRGQFRVRRILYDPYQMASVAQRLVAVGMPMEEYPQTPNRLEEMGTVLYDLIKHRNFVAYPDKDMRLAVSRAVATETTRGWRIAKEKTSHKIDVVVALAMAALGAVESQSRPVGDLIFADPTGSARDITGKPFRPIVPGRQFVGSVALPAKVRDFEDPTPGGQTMKSPFV